MSITSSFLKKEARERINQFIVRLVATSDAAGEHYTDIRRRKLCRRATNAAAANLDLAATNLVLAANANTGPSVGTNSAAALPPRTPEPDEKTVAVRKAVTLQIRDFIQNTRSGALGVTGSVLLIFVAISMLSRIEDLQ